jgi:hypothetical protein
LSASRTGKEDATRFDFVLISAKSADECKVKRAKRLVALRQSTHADTALKREESSSRARSAEANCSVKYPLYPVASLAPPSWNLTQYSSLQIR